MDEEQQGSTAPMGGDDFDATWQAARTGVVDEPPGQGATDGATGSPAANQGASGSDSPAADTPQAASPSMATEVPPAQTQPQWTPEQVQEWQQKARHFDSVQGNWNQIQQRWEQEKLSPLQQKLQQYEQEREAIRNWYISQQRPEQQAIIRQQFEAEQQTEQQRIAQQQQAAQFQQAQAQIAQERQQLAQQRESQLRGITLSTLDGFFSELAQSTGVPQSEISEYAERNNLRETLRSVPLNQIGPVMLGLEGFANTRAAQIARENAAKAAEQQKYRVEGGGGSGGQSSADNISKMNDSAFGSLWDRAMRGVAS